ncbi:MAG: U32 family peptidase [Paludibacteraceae bacterium]|nr:U32 family peptidase [Paludibacteraceae bacterium]
MSTSRLTILAPARDKEVGIAAIQAGADAVYIGPPKFGARQAAGNSIEDLKELVNYAHKYGVEVLVTLNTLMTAEERKEAAQMAAELYQIGVDALIIQDLRLLEEDLPPIRLHASTQCDNRRIKHIIRLRDLGFKRVVLARELTIEEIKSIHEAVGDSIELEAFVHGALCVSYSGRCYMSEVILNRSANRGCCAQMCRMQYDLLDEDMHEICDDSGKPIHQRYLLSLQDMDRSLYLKEMIDAGVSTFKIEGRLKDKDYVTNVVAYYRKKLDELTKDIHCIVHTDFEPSPEKTFHRGATDYFLHGRTRPMANWKSPKSTGEFIGIWEHSINERQGEIRLNPNIVLHNGDGLCYEDQGFAINRVEGNIITTNQPIHIEIGTPIYRNLDTVYTKTLHSERRIPVDIIFTETATGFMLRIGDNEAEFASEKEISRHPERAIETIKEQLCKLGDTPYTVRNITIESAPYFIPISKLNQWRRQLTQDL